MSRRLLCVSVVFILAVASGHGNLRAQSPSGEVVYVKGDRATICGILTRDEAPATLGAARSPFPHRILAKGKSFRIDPRKYKHLEGYLNRLPDLLRPLVHVEGTLDRNQGDEVPIIAVDLFQPLDHAREMGLVPSPTDEATAKAISNMGGLVVTLPSDYPLFDAFVVALTHAGFKAEIGANDERTTAFRKNGFLFAELMPQVTPDPAFLTALGIDPHVRVYAFRNTKEIDAVPPPSAIAKAQKVNAARGVGVVMPRGDKNYYDSIALGLRRAGFTIKGTETQRKAGYLVAEMRATAPDLKYVAALAHDPQVHVSAFQNYAGHIPAGEQGGPGEATGTTPPRP